MTELQGKSFWNQLKDRKVIRIALAYIIVSWIVLQVGEVVFEGLALPDWSLTLVIVLLMLGFPVSLVLAWAYEVTPDGIRKDPADLNIEAPEIPDYQKGAPSIAVLPFDDMSKNSDQAYFCEGMAEEILNALCKVANLRVA